MKRILLAVVLALVITPSANAQALLILLFGDKLSTETFQMGINVSGSYTTVNGGEEVDYRLSWAFGAYGEVKFNDDLYLQFDLTLKTPGGANNVDALFSIHPDVEDLIRDISISRQFNYISLPVNFKYKLGHWKLGAGGRIGYLTSASDIFSGTRNLEGEGDLELDFDVSSYMNRWDGGVTGILEYYFHPEDDMKSFKLSLLYYYGLTDIIKDNPGDAMTNSGFLLSIGIPIGGDDSETEE